MSYPRSTWTSASVAAACAVASLFSVPAALAQPDSTATNDASDATPAKESVTPADVRAAMTQGVDYLLSSQNADGSWGSSAKPSDGFWSNPESHRAWAVATTGLCCLALEDAGDDSRLILAHDRGLDFILANALVKRPSDWDVDNTWAYVYGLQVLATAHELPRFKDSPRRAEIRRVGQQVLGKLREYQSPDGGWGYYDAFDSVTVRPTWATSFMTAVVVLGMVDAKAAGFDVDEGMFRRAVEAVKRCKLPNGAYTYSVRAVPTPRGVESINQVKGSLGRIQVCNLALYRAGENITHDDFRVGLEQFFKHHRFLDVARKKPIPHEAFYQNSGYFYFFGHYYAMQVVRELPPDQRGAWWPRLRYEILKTQEQDGSMWDFYMNTFHRPYGTAYGLMTLQGSMPPGATKKG